MFTVNASMNIFGALMEDLNPLTRGGSYDTVDWRPYIYGCFAGIAPWIVIGLYFFGSGDIDRAPVFVYIILFCYLFFFCLFPFNMYLHYAMVGYWADHRRGEVGYVILSLTSKSLLAWIVFFGTFQPQSDD